MSARGGSSYRPWELPAATTRYEFEASDGLGVVAAYRIEIDGRGQRSAWKRSPWPHEEWVRRDDLLGELEKGIDRQIAETGLAACRGRRVFRA